MSKKVIVGVASAIALAVPAVVYVNFNYRKERKVSQQIFVEGKPEFLRKAAMTFLLDKSLNKRKFLAKDSLIDGWTGPKWEVDYGSSMSLDDCLTILYSETYLGPSVKRIELDRKRIQELAELIEQMEDLFVREENAVKQANEERFQKENSLKHVALEKTD